MIGNRDAEAVSILIQLPLFVEKKKLCAAITVPDASMAFFELANHWYVEWHLH